MSADSLEIRRSSGALRESKTSVRSQTRVAKYIDTSTCIGCKACEVACQEWNDLPSFATQQFGSYQTMPSLHAQFWNLIRFNEQETETGLAWLMRKDGCLHCEEPGCLEACPAPGAIVQYANGIVDVNPEACIGCGYCETGCPFDVPHLHPQSGKMGKCTLCVDRVGVSLEPACVKACPTGCLHFGAKDDMLALAGERVERLRSNGAKEAAIYDPPGVGGTGVITVLTYGDHPEWYGLPKDPHVPHGVRLWKNLLRPLGMLAIASTILGTFVHFSRFGRKEAAPGNDGESERRIT